MSTREDQYFYVVRTPEEEHQHNWKIATKWLAIGAALGGSPFLLWILLFYVLVLR